MRLARWCLAAAAVQLVAVLAWLTTYRDGFDPRGMPLGNDFAAFWFGARLALERGAVVAYDLPAAIAFQHAAWPQLVGAYAWVYPPSFLLLVLWTGLLPHVVAFVVWTLATLGAYLASVRDWLRGPYRWVVLGFPGLWLGLGQGQNQFLTAALGFAGLRLLQRHPVWAGVCIGLLAIKPHLALLFPVALAAARAWKAFASAAVTAVAVTLGSAAILGWGTLFAWRDAMGWVAWAVANDQLPVWMFPSPYALLLGLGVPVWVAWVVQGVVAVAAAAVVYRVWRVAPLPLAGSALIVATFLATPYWAVYDLAWLLLPVLWLLSEGRNREIRLAQAPPTECHAETRLGERGWRTGERPLLAAAWLLPYLASIAVVVPVQVAPWVLAGLLVVIWRQASTTGGSRPRSLDRAAQPPCTL